MATTKKETTTKKTPTKKVPVKQTTEKKTPTKSSAPVESKSSKVDVKENREPKPKKDKKGLLNAKTIYKIDKEYALRLKNVKKSFGFKHVLNGVTFDIKKGERLALIGKNGSGKSTLINIISQQLRPSHGEIKYGYATSRVESLELMGIQFQTLNYPEGFIVKDVIHFFNVSVEKSIRMSKRELSDMISMFGIDKYLNQSIDRLSGGQQQRINILLALIKKPKLLILVEISTGLDVESAEVIKGYIEQYLSRYPETALLLVSHSDEEIRELTERAVVLEAGKIVEKFESKKLNTKLFLEITSREPKLTKKEIAKQEKESEAHISQLKNRYSLFVPKKMINNKMDEGNIVEFRGVSKTYGKTVGAVRNMSLDIKAGSRIAITGPNGSGKSTIVEIIAQVKTMDKESKRYKNLYNLAKSDYKRIVSKLEEDLNVSLRQETNLYRLERDLSYNEAQELEKNKTNLAKEAKEKADKAAKKAGASEKAKEKAKWSLNDFKKEIDVKIAKIIKKADDEAAKAKEEIDNKVKDLKKKLVKDQEKAKQDYEAELVKISEQESKYKEDSNYRYSPSFEMNGKKLKGKEYSSEKPMIAYSFATTSKEVRDNVGVQFQYASFPVEMTVLDVILFFSRTNKYAMTREEILEAVKVFKLEKLLKSRAYRLSGGERQRLNVLLAIMKSPKLLILDEISTGLDVDSIVKIDAFIKDYLDKTGATLILISHNYHEVHSLTDRIVVMKYGKLTEIVDTKGWKLEQTKDKMRDIYKGGGN